MATATKTKKTFKWPSGTTGHTISWQAQQRRTKTAKLNAPIVPGSSITERQLAKAAGDATAVKYGPLDAQQQQQTGQAQQAAQDIGGAGGFYDQYLAQLAKNAANVNNIATQSNQAVQNTQNAVTGLGQADASQLQGQANAGAAARGMGPAGDLSGMANQATAIRQALVGSFAAQQAARNAAAQGYAGSLANVVGPGQKLAGQAVAAGKIKTAQDAQAATAREKGAYTSSYEDEQRQSEAKNVLAQQVAGVKSATELAKVKETTRTHKANEAIGRSRVQSEIDRANATAQRAADKRAQSGWFAGLTQTQIDGLTDSQAKQYIAKYDKGKGGKGGKGAAGGKGPDWLTSGEMGSGLSQASSLKDLFTRAKAGSAFDPKNQTAKWKKQPLSRTDAEAKVRQFVGPKVKNPILIRAAADSIYDTHLSAYTVKHLIAGGYKPSEVAAALGTTTHGQWLKTPAGKAWARTQANTKAYGNQGNLGQSGHA